MPAIGQGPMSSKYCSVCRRYTIHENLFAGMGCLLTVMSCGLFIPFWILVQLTEKIYQCQYCGTKRRR